MSVLWWLIVGHALGDFVLQTDTMAKGKNRHRPADPSSAWSQYLPGWPYWLAAHALVHGGIVALATGSVLLGLAETAAHAAIDFGKTEKWYGLHFDQFLHIACKCLWAALLYFGVVCEP